MKIEVLCIAGCLHVALAVEPFRAALALVGVEATIETTEMADGVAFAGSPTVLVSGRDVCDGHETACSS
jgi:hypothetical protein